MTSEALLYNKLGQFGYGHLKAYLTQSSFPSYHVLFSTWLHTEVEGLPSEIEHELLRKYRGTELVLIPEEPLTDRQKYLVDILSLPEIRKATNYDDLVRANVALQLADQGYFLPFSLSFTPSRGIRAYKVETEAPVNLYLPIGIAIKDKGRFESKIEAYQLLSQLEAYYLHKELPVEDKTRLVETYPDARLCSCSHIMHLFTRPYHVKSEWRGELEATLLRCFRDPEDKKDSGLLLDRILHLFQMR